MSTIDTTVLSALCISPTNAVLEEDTMYVITRSGLKEPLSQDKITQRLIKLIQQEPKIKEINPYQLVIDVTSKLVNLISTSTIDNYVCSLAASRSIAKPTYMKLASRLAVDSHQKNTLSNFYDKVVLFHNRLDDNGNSYPLVSDAFYKYVRDHRKFIESTIDYSRDFLCDYFGMRTFQDSYSLKLGEIPIERPQDLYMRTAIGLHMNTHSDIQKEYQYIKNSYDKYSYKKITQASPTYFNIGTNHEQLASCFLLAVKDSHSSIMKIANDMAGISKWSGGLGVHMHELRSRGALIRKTNGRTNGIVPFIRIYNNIMLAFNQGGGKGKGKRNGSAAIYLMLHHPDIVDFLNLKLPSTIEENRASDLFYGLWVPDIFMNRVKSNQLWSLFDPDHVGDLSNYFGKEYESKYLQYEQEKKYKSQIPARELWEMIYKANELTGMPYICFSDAVNKHNMQSNIGVIKCSNLCVSGDTKILTNKGYENIKVLTNTSNGKHKIWNGEEFTKAQFAKTGTECKLLKVTFSDGVELKCTKEHRFAIKDGYKNNYFELEAKDLSIGDTLIRCDYPTIDNKDNSFKYPYTHGFFCGDGTYNEKKGNGVPCKFLAVENSSFCMRHKDMGFEEKESASNLCQGRSDQRLPFISLYGEKKELIEYLNYVKSYTDVSNDKITIQLKIDIASKYKVPVEYGLSTKLKWLSGYFDADGCVTRNTNSYGIQICSINKEFLMNVKLLCNTLGCNPVISLMRSNSTSLLPDGKGSNKLFDTLPLYRLLFATKDVKTLYDQGMETHRLIIGDIEEITNKKRFISIKSIEELEELEDTYCFNEPKRHMGIFNGIIAMNCTEIVEFTDERNQATCNLGSVSLSSCVTDSHTPEELQQPIEKRRILDNDYPLNPTFDFLDLIDNVKTLVVNLNNIIDKTYYPTEETKTSNDRHRPIGVGLQGLADAFIKMRYPFESEEADKLNKTIAEVMYYAALSQSAKLSRDLYLKYVSICKKTGSVTITKYLADYTTESITFTDPTDIPKNIGAYGSMYWNGGSPLANGKFHHELYNVKPADQSQNPKLDWESLRNLIGTFGVRNSLLVALMPTATTSQFLGNNECFEPYTSNLYKRKTLSGEFIIINKYLIHELDKLKIWNENIKNYLILSNGSIQAIEGIPDKIKLLYKTSWEIDQADLVDKAIARQYYVDQAQSFNLYVENPSLAKFTNLMFRCHKGGLKTGKYYLHSRPGGMPQPFTIDPEAQNQILKILEKDNVKQVTNTENLVICDSCSA